MKKLEQAIILERLLNFSNKQRGVYNARLGTYSFVCGRMVEKVLKGREIVTAQTQRSWIDKSDANDL